MQQMDSYLELDGWLERERFSPVLLAFLVSVAVFFLFQLVSSIFAVLFVILEVGTAQQDVLMERLALLATPEFAVELMLANTLGQILGMALPVWLISRLHTRQVARFLRFQPVSWGALGYAALGLIVMMPVVQWLASVNAHIPLPEVIEEFDRQQMALLNNFLQGLSPGQFPLALLMLAIVPAFCEEMLFRGYVQRQLERGLHVGVAIVVTGVLFGFYHLRFTQAIPLSLIGIYLAYLTWRTRSLWPAILVHFLNNGFALTLGFYARLSPDVSMEDIEQWPVPWYMLLLSVVLSVWVLREIHRRIKPYEVAS